MRPLALLSLSAVAAAVTTPPTMPNHVEVIEREAGRDYTVKLECIGCPVRAWTSPNKAEWLHPSPHNSLVSISYRVEKGSPTNHELVAQV
jgi:hypothetical protein